jgi:dienelactone hydrolase
LKKLVVAFGVVLLCGLGFASIVGYRAWAYVRSTVHPPRVTVPAPPDVDGLREVSFNEPQGIKLAGWWVPSKNRAAVILCHGWAANRDQLRDELLLLARHGYGVLAFDSPGHGSSEGEVTWGDKERDALAAAITFVQAQPDVDPARVGALGFSMGGSTVTEVASRDPRLKGVVLSGTYTSLNDEFHATMNKWGPFSVLPAMKALESTGIDVNAVRPVAMICQIAPREVMIIDGNDDPHAPLDMEKRLFAAACEPKSLWIVDGAHHGDYARVDPAGYEQHLVSLFDRSLLK